MSGGVGGGGGAAGGEVRIESGCGAHREIERCGGVVFAGGDATG